MRFIICFIQASKGQGKIDNNSPNIQKKKLIKWQKGMLSIFFPQNSPLKPLKTEHFLFELFPFFSLPSFIQQTRPDVSVHCRPGWRLVFIVIFLIYYLFSFYFVLCVFQLLSIGEAGLKVPHSCGEEKKKKLCDVFYLQEALNEMKALASPCYSSSEKSYLNTWDTSWIGHCLLGGLLGLMSLQYSHSLIHLNTAGHLMLATASTLLSFLRGRLLKELTAWHCWY